MKAHWSLEGASFVILAMSYLALAADALGHLTHPDIVDELIGFRWPLYLLGLSSIPGAIAVLILGVAAVDASRQPAKRHCESPSSTMVSIGNVWGALALIIAGAATVILGLHDPYSGSPNLRMIGIGEGLSGMLLFGIIPTSRPRVQKYMHFAESLAPTAVFLVLSSLLVALMALSSTSTTFSDPLILVYLHVPLSVGAACLWSLGYRSSLLLSATIVCLGLVAALLGVAFIKGHQPLGAGFLIDSIAAVAVALGALYDDSLLGIALLIAGVATIFGGTGIQNNILIDASVKLASVAMLTLGGLYVSKRIALTPNSDSSAGA